LLRWATVPQQSGPKSEGAAVPLSVIDLDPHLTQCRLGRVLPSYQVASSSIQPFGYNTSTLQTGQTGEQSHSIGRTVTCNGRPEIDRHLARLLAGEYRRLFDLLVAGGPVFSCHAV